MMVYVAIIHDRHAEPDAEVFTTADAAITYARTWAQEHAHFPDDFEEHDVKEWLYYADYSCEGDSVWVLEKNIDAEVCP